MSGKKGAQRTKGNVKPSSSSRAAEVLSARHSDGHSFGFVSFNSGLANPSYSTESYSNEQPGSSNVVCSDPEFRIVLKKMNKRDAVTKLKGLQEFLDCCKVKEDAALEEILPFFLRAYGKLTMEYDRRVREAAQLAFKQLVTRIPSQLQSPTFLRAVSGMWLFAQCDPYAPAASTARTAFAAAFPTPVEQSRAMLSCLNESTSVLSDLLLNSSPSTLLDPAGTPLEELNEKLERIISCSLYAIRLLLHIIVGQSTNRRSAEPLSREVVSAVEGALSNTLSDARLWKLAKHEFVLVREGFYAFLSCLCVNFRELMLTMPEKICPVVLGNLHAADRVTCSFIWVAALAILIGVKNWWQYVNIRKAVLPSLWSVLRHGGNGLASITHPNCLPLLHHVGKAISSSNFGDLHSFMVEFLSSMREGMNCEKVQRSPDTLAIVAQAFIDCVAYSIRSEVERGVDVAKIQVDLVDNQFIAAIRTSTVQRSASSADTQFYQRISELLTNWYMRSLNMSKVQPDFVTTAFAQLVPFFWSRLTAVCLEVIAEYSAADGTDERSVVENVPVRIADLICVMSGDSDSFKNRHVAAAATSDDPTGFTDQIISKDFDQSVMQSDAPYSYEDLLVMGSAVSAAMFNAIMQPSSHGPTVTTAMAYVVGLARIVDCISCPRYFAALSSRLTYGQPTAAVASDCRLIVSQLVDYVTRRCESTERVPVLVKLIAAFGRHLEGDPERLIVLRDLFCVRTNIHSLPLIALQTMLSVDIWHGAISKWSTSPEFQEVMLELADRAIQCLRTSDDQGTACDFATILEAARCVPADCRAFLEGTTAIVKATTEMLKMRPIPMATVTALKYTSKILSCCEVPNPESAFLGVELYRLMLDGYASAEMYVHPTVCCQLAEQLCRSPEFKVRLTEVIMSDLTGDVPIERLEEIVQTITALEPALNKSFMEGLVMQNTDRVMSTSWNQLVQWLSILAVRCDILLESYQIFDQSALANAVAPGTDLSSRECGVPAALPFVCLALLAAFSERRANADPAVSTDVSKTSAARLHCNYSYLCNPRFLCATSWVTSCWRAAVSSNLAPEVTYLYNSEVLDMVTGFLKELDWSWFGQDALGQTDLLNLATSEALAGPGASGVEYLLTDVLTKEVCSLGCGTIIPDLSESFMRLMTLTSKEFHCVLSVFPHNITFRTQLNGDHVLMLLDILADAVRRENPAAATRVLYVLISVFTLSDSLLSDRSTCSIMDLLMSTKKWALAPVISKQHLKDDVSVLQWNFAVMLLLGRIVLQTSSSLNSNHWDYVLCTLVEWTDKSCSLKSESWTFAEAAFVANASSLVSHVASIMKGPVTLQPASYPQGLLTEWAELHCQELFARILPHIFNGPTVRMHSGPGHRLALSCLCRAASWCPARGLVSYSLPPAKVAGLAAERRRLLGDQPSHFKCSIALTYVVDRLFVRLCSEEAPVQAAAYVLLLQLVPELAKCADVPTVVLDGNNIRAVPALFEWVLNRCIDDASGAVVENYGGKRGQMSIVAEGARNDGRSQHCHLLRAYLLTWKLLLKYLQYCSSEVRIEHVEYLKQQKMIERVLNILVDFIPMEKLASSKPGSYVFSKNATVNFDASADVQEELISIGCSLFYSLVNILRALVRSWRNGLDKATSQAVDKFTFRYVSPEIFMEEMETLQTSNLRNDKLTMAIRLARREIAVRYSVDNLLVKVLIKIPANYPIGLMEVECDAPHKTKGCDHQKWIRQLLLFLAQQNGTVLDALRPWTRNMDKKLEGIDECPICFFILHSRTLQTPNRACPTCKKMFHGSCLLSWHSTSAEAKCPCCRSPWVHHQSGRLQAE